MSTAATIRDTSRNGLFEITDTNAWNGAPNALRVTVREQVGEREISPARLRAMRDLAKRALPGARSARTERTWFAQGQSHATFLVSL